ncbi:MAG: hypothetical protein AAFR96_09290 [Planctomycetota bacterium]
MAWSYSNWRQQPGDAARLERLRLHMQEVADKITVDVEGDGFKKLSSPVRLYYESLQKQHDELEKRTRGRLRVIPVSFNG